MSQPTYTDRICPIQPYCWLEVARDLCLCFLWSCLTVKCLRVRKVYHGIQTKLPNGQDGSIGHTPAHRLVLSWPWRTYCAVSSVHELHDARPSYQQRNLLVEHDWTGRIFCDFSHVEFVYWGFIISVNNCSGAKKPWLAVWIPPGHRPQPLLVRWSLMQWILMSKVLVL